MHARCHHFHINMLATTAAATHQAQRRILCLLWSNWNEFSKWILLLEVSNIAFFRIAHRTVTSYCGAYLFQKIPGPAWCSPPNEPHSEKAHPNSPPQVNSIIHFFFKKLPGTFSGQLRTLAFSHMVSKMCEYSLCLSSELLRDVFSSLFSFFVFCF